MMEIKIFEEQVKAEIPFALDIAVGAGPEVPQTLRRNIQPPNKGQIEIQKLWTAISKLSLLIWLFSFIIFLP